MSMLSRLLVLLASALVLAALVTPLWRIRLLAPQYPKDSGWTSAGAVVGARETISRASTRSITTSG